MKYYAVLSVPGSLPEVCEFDSLDDLLSWGQTVPLPKGHLFVFRGTRLFFTSGFRCLIEDDQSYPFAPAPVAGPIVLDGSIEATGDDTDYKLVTQSLG